MKCQHCGQEIPDNASYCPYCHTPVIRIKPKHLCSNCGAEIPDGADRCPGCGAKVRRPNKQDRIVPNFRLDNENDKNKHSLDRMPLPEWLQPYRQYLPYLPLALLVIVGIIYLMVRYS